MTRLRGFEFQVFSRNIKRFLIKKLKSFNGFFWNVLKDNG